jgi:hypothetical protein
MSFGYRSCRDDSDLSERLLQLAREKPRYGYRRLQVLRRVPPFRGDWTYRITALGIRIRPPRSATPARPAWETGGVL